MAGREKRVVGNAKGQFAPRQEPLRVGYGQSSRDGSGGWVRNKPADKIGSFQRANQSMPVNRQPQPEMKPIRATSQKDRAARIVENRNKQAGGSVANTAANTAKTAATNTRRVLEDAFRKQMKKKK